MAEEIVFGNCEDCEIRFGESPFSRLSNFIVYKKTICPSCVRERVKMETAERERRIREKADGEI